MFGVLPDGSVVVNSSNLAVTKSNSFSIEQGRDPHIELDVNEDISQLELGTAFDMIMDYQLLEERTGDTVTMSMILIAI